MCCSSPSLGYSVSSHAGVVFAVTPGRPQEQSGCHHLQREGDEGEVEGPAQRALHPLWWWGIMVEQIHPGPETADGAQSAQTWWVEERHKNLKQHQAFFFFVCGGSRVRLQDRLMLKPINSPNSSWMLTPASNHTLKIQIYLIFTTIRIFFMQHIIAEELK